MKREHLPQYLVRPHDFHIWELDLENNKYRSYSTKNVTYQDRTRPSGHYDLAVLLAHGFFEIEKKQIPDYERKHKEHTEFVSWQCRPDGHGGAKGGTWEEFLNYKEKVKEYQKTK